MENPDRIVTLDDLLALQDKVERKSRYCGGTLLQNFMNESIVIVPTVQQENGEPPGSNREPLAPVHWGKIVLEGRARGLFLKLEEKYSQDPSSLLPRLQFI